MASLILLGVALVLAGAGAAARYATHRRCRRLVGEARGAVGTLADAVSRRDLTAHLACLEARLARGWLYAKRDVLLGRLRREAEGVHAAALGRVASPHLEPGHHVIVTVSRVDGADLPTSVTVPDGWNGTDPLPLVLVLHAGGVDEMMDCFPAPSHPRALCVEPLARGSHDYIGVQMTAVEECLADVRARYPAEGLYVLGSSQGGMGTWLFAQRHAGEVTGLSPWAANADPDAWQGQWEDDPTPPRSPAGRAHRLVCAARAPVARVESLATPPDLPILVGHGARDTMIPIGHSISMVEKLRALDATGVTFLRFEDHGHKDIPLRIRGRIDVLLDAGAPTSGRFVAVIPPLTFVADGIGVPPHRVIDPLQPARVVVEGGRIVETENAEPAGNAGPSKWHYPCHAGSVFDHPFGLYLPRGLPEHVRDCADEFEAQWRRRYGGRARRLADRERRQPFPVEWSSDTVRTVVVLGSPEESPLVRGTVRGLDVRAEAGRASVFGRTVEGEDIGLVMLRPDPDQPRGGILVVWGSTPAAYRQLWRRFGHDVDWEGARGRWWFDYAVFDRKTCGPDSFLLVGFFDPDWRFDPKLVFEGSAEVRAGIPGSHWPVGSPDVSAKRVPLSSLPPESIESPRGPVGFDRSASPEGRALTIQGKRFERGLGMVPPATVQWRLGGQFAELTMAVGLERTGGRWPIRHAAERVRFEMWGDGRRLAASPALSATDGAVELTADLSGIDLLELRAVNATSHVWHYGPVGWGDATLRRAD